VNALLPALNPAPGNLFGNGLAVAIVALLHVQIATFIIGGSALAAVSEGISMARDDRRHEEVAHGLIKSMTYVFSFGAALAIFWVLWILLGLWGRFFVAVTQITFWVFVFEAATFFVQIVLLYSIYANWERLRAYRRARLGLLILLTVVLWWQMFFIDVVTTYMLTPNGGDRDQLAQVLNPTMLPLTLHRTVGNIAWTGALMAAYAGIRYLRATRRSRQPAPALGGSLPARSVGAMAADALPEERDPHVAERLRHYDWLGQWGLLWAVGMSLFQIWIGYSYAKEIQLHAYPAWFRMMFGALSNVFLAQIFLLGMIFILGTVYFMRRMQASKIGRVGLQKACLFFLILATLLAVQPAWFALSREDVVRAKLDRPWWDGGLLNPIGNFIPNKVIALTVMMLAGLIALTSYLRAYSGGRIVLGQTTRPLQRVIVTLAITVSLMMMIMGVIRENSRQPYLINGELRIEHQEIVPSSQRDAPAGSAFAPTRVRAVTVS
jgi:hypothetical protein